MLKILIVEDDDHIRDLLGQVVEMFGHKAFLADTVEKATEVLNAVHPNLIFLDLLMHGTVSTPFIAVARALLNGHPARIVILSAMTGAAKVAEQNGVEFMSKPFSLEGLKEIVDSTK